MLSDEAESAVSKKAPVGGAKTSLQIVPETTPVDI